MHPLWQPQDSDLPALTECGMRVLAAVGLAVNLGAMLSIWLAS